MNKFFSQLVVFILFVAVNSYADEIEENFKAVCKSINQEASETISPIGQNIEITSKEINDTTTRHNNLIKMWQEQLESLISKEPNSLWADDAQYLIILLNIQNPPRKVIELEKLLNNYPNFILEDWTKKSVQLVSQNTSLETLTLELCFLYKETGEFEKLKLLCEDSKKTFPEKAGVCQKLLNLGTTSK